MSDMSSKIGGLGGGFLLSLIAGCATPSPRADLVYFPPPPAAPRAVHLKSFNSLSDLVSRKERGWSSVLGTAGGGDFVEAPLGIAYAQGHLYICDTALHCVHDWDLGAGMARRITGSEAGALQTPTAVAVASNGRVFVADTGRGDIAEFDTAGSFVRSIKPRDGFRPVGLAACTEDGGACNDGELLVADAASGRAEVLSMTQGGIVRSLDHSAAKGALLMGVASHGDRVYATDMLGGRILAFDNTGGVVATMSQRGDRYGDLGQPRGIAMSDDGIVFVADPDFGFVHLFNESGQFLMLLGGSDQLGAATPFPVGVATTSTLPEPLVKFLPTNFHAKTFLFVSNSVGVRRINLFAIGEAPR